MTRDFQLGGSKCENDIILGIGPESSAVGLNARHRTYAQISTLILNRNSQVDTRILGNMSGILSSLVGKAQSAIATSPLASKLPAGGAHQDATAAGRTSTSSDTHHQPGYAPPSQEQSGSLSGRHHGLETIQHHLRSLQVQYSSVVLNWIRLDAYS